MRTGQGFGDTSTLVFVGKSCFLLSLFYIISIVGSNSDRRKWLFNDPVMIHIRKNKQFLDTVTVVLIRMGILCRRLRWMAAPRTFNSAHPFRHSFWKFNAALSLRKVSTLSHGWVVLSERQEGWARQAALNKQRTLKGLKDSVNAPQRCLHPNHLVHLLPPV